MRRINGIADFFGGNRRGLDMEAAVQPPGFHQGLQDKLGHYAPADISVADEQDSHKVFVSTKLAFCLKYQ